MIHRILYFLLALALGLFIIAKTYLWVSWTGKSSWAETKIGSGGTYTMWKAAGIAIIIFGFMLLFGTVKLGPDQKVPATNPNTVNQVNQ